MFKSRILFALAAAAGLVLVSCGSDDSPSAGSAAPPPPSAATSPAPAPAAPAAGASVSVKAATSPLGQILVDADGRTLYAFTNDTEAKSTCTGTCAEAWPPVVVDANWTVAPGLDSGVFSTITRDDGALQLAAGQFPLYLFSGDARPGDVNGQGSGNVWFVVDPNAQIVQGAGAAAAPAATPAAEPATLSAKTAESPLGAIVVNGEGVTLYGFTKDVDGTPTCVDACADAWPAAIVDGELAVEGLDPALFSVVERPDGGQQLKMGKWPLYSFSGDAAPGDVNGQGSGGSWFVVAQDGKLVK